MQDLKEKSSIWLDSAYQVWYVCLQVKTRFLQHTNSQLETFWTHPVRAVILDDELYQATWYKIDWRNRTQYTPNPIWIESTVYINFIKPCNPYPSRYWTQILKYLVLYALIFKHLNILIMSVSEISFLLESEWFLTNRICPFQNFFCMLAILFRRRSWTMFLNMSFSFEWGIVV